MKSREQIIDLAEKLKDKSQLAWVEMPDYVPVPYHTPAYPPAAYALAEQWERDKRKPALYLAIRHTYPQMCRNCNGIGGVYMMLCNAGPLSSPGGLGQVSTFYEGNERFPRGWYAVDQTYAYACPVCGVAK